LNHYPHHIGDFVKDTMGFSQGAIGAYRLLIDAYYANEEAPAKEEVYVIGRATTQAERKNVDKALTKFELRDGHYFHKRVEEELAAYYGRSDSARVNGKKGGRPKKPTDNRKGNPQETGAVTETGTEQITGTATHSEPSEKLASSQKPINPTPSKRFPDVRDISAEPPLAALLLLVEQDGRISLSDKGRMHLAQWVTEGLTTAQLDQAIRLARQRKPSPELIPFAYLVPIVEDVKAGRAVDPEEPRGKDAIPAALARIAARDAREADATTPPAAMAARA